MIPAPLQFHQTTQFVSTFCLENVDIHAKTVETIIQCRVMA
jgi:hypothetical protein